MATITTTRPASASLLRQFIIRHPVAAFLGMAFALGWTTLLPLLLSEQGFGVLPIELPVTLFQFLASFVGLTVPAFLILQSQLDSLLGHAALVMRAPRSRLMPSSPE